MHLFGRPCRTHGLRQRAGYGHSALTKGTGVSEAFASTLPPDGVPVDQRVDFVDPPAVEPVEHVLGERHPLSCRLEAQELVLRSALKEEPAGHDAVVGEQDLRDELKVGDRVRVRLQHRAIPAQSERASVVHDVVGDVLTKIRPSPIVEARKVTAVGIEQVLVFHRLATSLHVSPGHQVLQAVGPTRGRPAMSRSPYPRHRQDWCSPRTERHTSSCPPPSWRPPD